MRLKAVALIFSVFLLSACSEKVELFGSLTEADANEVVAKLYSQDIMADKVAGKEGVSVLVESEDMANAVDILDAAGLPKKQRSSLGDVFRKEGVISSPLEERARYIYALSQELEGTLSQVDGVVVARVHVVLPEKVAPGENMQPASAAVFIKHLPSLNPDILRPRIKRMVMSSIPGLASGDNKLAIVFVPAEVYKKKETLVSFGPMLIRSEELFFWKTVVTTVIALIAILIISLLCLTVPPLRRACASLLPARKKAGSLPPVKDDRQSGQ